MSIPWFAKDQGIARSKWHSPYILIYKDPLLTYLFGICAIYFDLAVKQKHIQDYTTFFGESMSASSQESSKQMVDRAN